MLARQFQLFSIQVHELFMAHCSCAARMFGSLRRECRTCMCLRLGSSGPFSLSLIHPTQLHQCIANMRLVNISGYSTRSGQPELLFQGCGKHSVCSAMGLLVCPCRCGVDSINLHSIPTLLCFDIYPRFPATPLTMDPTRLPQCPLGMVL